MATSSLSCSVVGWTQPQHQSQGTVLVQGTVLDENNEPVIGASVVQKGARGNAVATDAFGNFKL